MIRTLEEYTLNALPPLQTIMYDGWVLRLAGGYTKRANSVNPLYLSVKDPALKIQYCENLYTANHLETVFKITPASSPGNLDCLLAERGYQVDAPTSVQVLALDKISHSIDKNIIFSTTLTEKWLQDFCRFNQIAEKNQPILRYML